MILDHKGDLPYQWIAVKVGINKAAVFGAMNGNPKRVSLETFLKIADAVNMPESEARNEWVDCKIEMLKDQEKRYEALRTCEGDRT